MTDSRTEQLATASFRGVTFGVRNEAQDSSGRKIVLHEYVNSPERFIEDLGELSPTFTIDAFISGINFLSDSQRLENALNLGGFASLTLPTLGTFRVQALPYRKRAAQTSVGEIVFSLEFATGRPSAGPLASLRDVQEVFSLGDDARSKIAELLAETFNIPSSAENISVFGSDLTVSSQAILDAFKEILPTSNLSTISRINDDISRNSSSLTQNLSEIGKLFIVDGDNEGIFQSLSLGLTGSTFTQALAGFTSLIDFTNFGTGSIFNVEDNRGAFNTETGIPLWTADTKQRVDKNENRVSIANSNQVNALIAAYEVGANIEYSTKAEIQENRELLEAAHEAVMFDQTTDENIIQSNPDVRFAVEDVRIAALDVLEQKAQTSTTTVEVIKVSPNSSFVEAYLRYSDDIIEPSILEDRSIELRNLNPDRKADALDNDITVFRN